MGFDRQMIADHANNLASNVAGNLKRSLDAIGVVRFPSDTTSPETTAVAERVIFLCNLRFFFCKINSLPPVHPRTVAVYANLGPSRLCAKGR